MGCVYGGGTYTSGKNIIAEMNKNNLKCDCINGSIMDDIRKPILFSFSLDKPSSYEIIKAPIL